MTFLEKLHAHYAYMKFDLLGLYYRLNKRNWRQIQKQRLADIMQYALMHSKYYKSQVENCVITKDNAVDVLQRFPIISKQIILEKEWDIYSDEVPKDNENWRNTGGSTGEPMKFPAIASPYYMEDICEMMLYRRMGFRWGDILVSFGGYRVSDEERQKNIYWVEKYNLPYGKFNYSTLYLDESTFPYYLESFNTVKPQFINGYPTGVLTFCRYIESTESEIDFKLKGIYLTSENFTKQDKEYISSILGCPVYGQYGHTECSIFAVQAPDEERYICSPIYGYTEVLDSDGKQVEKGKVGEITVTGFSIYGLPFVRYRTGDLAVYGGCSEYGETILSQLLGRDVDFLIDHNGKKIFTVGFIFGGHLKAFNHIKTWQIVQNEIGKLEVFIVKHSNYEENIEKEIVSFFESSDFTVVIKYVDYIPMTKRGKRRFVIQNCK